MGSHFREENSQSAQRLPRTVPRFVCAPLVEVYYFEESQGPLRSEFEENTKGDTSGFGVSLSGQKLDQQGERRRDIAGID